MTKRGRKLVCAERRAVVPPVGPMRGLGEVDRGHFAIGSIYPGIR
jgi:hypothetical protein